MMESGTLASEDRWGGADLELWKDLMSQLEGVRLNSEKDKVTWVLEKSGRFTTKSMYRWFLHRGVLNKRLCRIWKCRLPVKIKVFLWQISNNRIPTGAELKKRNWRGSAVCNICETSETADHIFFSRVMAKFVWSCFKEALGWDRIPASWQDLLDNWIPLGGADYNSKLFTFAIILWSIWTSRNKRMIEGKFPRSPTELLYNCNSFLQKWKVLLRGGERSKVEAWTDQAKSWVEMFLEKLRNRPQDDLFM